jgi:hypothetical protein
MKSGVFAETAPSLWASGIPVIPLRPASKRPAISRWQVFCDRLPTSAEQAAWLSAFPDGNIGLPLGQSSGLVALDVDNFSLAIIFDELAQAGIPPVWKRVGRKGAVLLFRFNGQCTKRYFLADGTTAFELLSSGAQVVIPPSIHPETGEPYCEEEPLVAAIKRAPELPSGLLDAIAQRHCVSPRIASRGNSEMVSVGGRDVSAIRKAGELAGKAARGELCLGSAVSEFEAWFDQCIAQPPEDQVAIEKYIIRIGEFFERDCTQRDSKGEPLKLGNDVYRIAPLGWNDALTPGDLARLGLLGEKFEIGSAIPLIGRDYILVSHNKSFIDTESGEAISGDHLITKFAPYIDESSHQRKLDAVIQDRSVARVDYVRMRPGKPPGIVSEPPYKVFNIFRGYSVAPERNVTNDDVRPYLELTRLQVPDPIQRKYLLDWEAHTLQFPDKPKSTCPLMVSLMGGTGKSQRVQSLGSLLHESHFRVVSIEHLESRFNAWRDSTILAFVDEVESGNRAQANRVIKSIVGNEKYEREQKHEATRQESNFNNLYLTSNRLDAVRIDAGDRRYFVIEIDDDQHRAISSGFSFDEFNKWLNENRHKLLGWFLNRDLAGFDPYAPAPVTLAKMRMQGLALPTWEAQLDAELDELRGRFFKDIVCVAELSEHISQRYRVNVSDGHLVQWLRRRKARTLSRRHFEYVVRTRGSFSVDRVSIKATPWIVRNHSRWLSAGEDAVKKEILKDPLSPLAGDEPDNEKQPPTPAHLPNGVNLLVEESDSDRAGDGIATGLSHTTCPA